MASLTNSWLLSRRERGSTYEAEPFFSLKKHLHRRHRPKERKRKVETDSGIFPRSIAASSVRAQASTPHHADGAPPANGCARRGVGGTPRSRRRAGRRDLLDLERRATRYQNGGDSWDADDRWVLPCSRGPTTGQGCLVCFVFPVGRGARGRH